MRPPPYWGKRASSAATASLVIGIISLCFWPLGTVGLLCGIQAHNDVKRRDMTGNGQMVAGLILNIITTAASAVLLAVLIAGVVSG